MNSFDNINYDIDNHNDIHSVIRRYKAIYRLLNRVSPIDTDCGKLCGEACCRGSYDELALYLLPGEELLHQNRKGCLSLTAESTETFDFPESWGPVVYTATCTGPEHCDRPYRPIQCRTYPLMPYITEDGALEIIYNDNVLPYSCPLIEKEIPLNDDFVQATRTAWKHLLRDPRIRELVQMDSEAIREAEE